MLKVFAIRSLVAAACVCAVAAVGASTAAAAASPPGIVIGPIKVHHGFTLTLFDSSCTSVANTGGLTLEYSKGGSKLSISHDYSGGASVCKLSKKLGSGSLTASWPGVATIKLKVKNPGKLSKPKAPPGCHGSGGTGRNAVVRGTLKVDIHTGAFGKVNAHKAPAVLDTSGNFSCKPTGNNDISLFGIFGPSPNAFVSGTQPPRGQRSVLISVTGAPLAGGITDEFGLYSQGASKVFNAASTLSSATIGAAAPYMTGSLTFTALPPVLPRCRPKRLVQRRAGGARSRAWRRDDRGISGDRCKYRARQRDPWLLQRLRIVTGGAELHGYLLGVRRLFAQRPSRLERRAVLRLNGRRQPNGHR